MQPFTVLGGIAAPLMIPNLDTDQILPKQFLKTIERSGLARGLFHDLRFDPTGVEVAEFILNRQPFRSARILIAGENFGCGSSREHAPWALIDYGIRCVIAPSFADIFHNNCFNNGLLPIALPKNAVDRLAADAVAISQEFSVSLPEQSVRSSSGQTYRFEIDPVRKKKLLSGIDAIAETLALDEAILAFETRRRERHELI